MHRTLAAYGRGQLKGQATLERVDFSHLDGFAWEDHLDAHQAIIGAMNAIVGQVQVTRPAQHVPPQFVTLASILANLPKPATSGEARQLLETWFQPYRIRVKHHQDGPDGFLTGYYEPVVSGSLQKTPAFQAPILARPADLVTFARGLPSPLPDARLSAGRQNPDGTTFVFPDRASIESNLEHYMPIVWLTDQVEVFLVQVQGSAKVNLGDGHFIRLGYAGRNGHPYTSIGRILIESGDIPEPEMSLARLKQWIRQAGQESGDPGRMLMDQNQSYVFFKIEEGLTDLVHPIGGAGVSLFPLRSVAVDRDLWHYGLPFWIEAELNWRGQKPEPFRRLMIAQDTGSAIVGPARADIYFGSGAEAGRIAGNIRQNAKFFVLLPKGLEE